MDNSENIHEEERFFIRRNSEFTENKRYLTAMEDGVPRFNTIGPVGALSLKKTVAKVYKADIVEGNDDIEKKDIEIVRASVQVVETEVLPDEVPHEYQET